jgi:TatD DNase family protein
MKHTLIDSHCHVHFQAYAEDMDEVVQRALASGVGMITVGTQTSTSKKAVELARRYEGVWATIGLHPNHLHAQEFFDEDELPPEERATGKIKTRNESFNPDDYRELVTDPNVVAVGEFGLDYYRIPDGHDRDQVIADQKEECRKQLAFASEYDKPIVIHCRDAHQAQYELLKAEIDAGGLKKHGVIHSFTGTIEDAARYRELGFMLGLNGILTFSKELQEVIRVVPLEQIIIETDAPYLTPPPNRGKRNEPEYVKHIAEFIAELKGVSVEEVAEQTTEQTITLFQLK